MRERKMSTQLSLKKDVKYHLRKEIKEGNDSNPTTSAYFIQFI